MNIPDLQSKFLRYCALEERLSPKTVEGLKGTIGLFTKRTLVDNVRTIDLGVLRGFFYEGIERYQWGYWTQMNYIKYLKKFFNWCVKEGYIDKNPILRMAKPRKPQSLPRRLTLEEGQKILLTAFHRGWRYEFERTRNYAIIASLLYSGLRAKELLNLTIIDVNLDVGNILVRNGKGGKDRNVPIHSKLKYILKRYLMDCKRLGKMSEYFFTGVGSSKKLNYKDLSRLCRKISIASGIKFSPHCLRHTFGSVCIEQRMGLPQLQAIMGHSNVASTMIYVSMNSKGLREGMESLELF